jgi:hypothetical protein
MFKFFRKKTKMEQLSVKYERLLEKSHKMMSYNRRESDRLQAEANEVYQQMVKLKTAI